MHLPHLGSRALFPAISIPQRAPQLLARPAFMSMVYMGRVSIQYQACRTGNELSGITKRWRFSYGNVPAGLNRRRAEELPRNWHAAFPGRRAVTNTKTMGRGMLSILAKFHNSC